MTSLQAYLAARKAEEEKTTAENWFSGVSAVDFREDIICSEREGTIAQNVRELDAAFIVDAKNHYPKLIRIIEVMSEALAYYANPPNRHGDNPAGTRLEFGCGCCSGTVDGKDYEGSHDFDKDVQGLTAREALAAVEALLEGKE